MCAFVILASSSTPLPVWPVMLSVATALQQEAPIAPLVLVAPSRWRVQMSALLPAQLAIMSYQEFAMLVTAPVQPALPLILTTAQSAVPPPSLGSVVLSRILPTVSRPVLPQPLLCPSPARVILPLTLDCASNCETCSSGLLSDCSLCLPGYYSHPTT